ncbi:MAG: hypothetical protein EHM17_02810 [Verrucomicrobiaceae bacterium]|nr:MAG: hypothetical protein EHM17_02810 [Verrucomicrobiaceae bacterium]
MARAADAVELLEDPQFAQGFGAGWYYGLQEEKGPMRLRVTQTGYRDISPYKMKLIPDGPVEPGSTKDYPWDFEEGLHHDFTDSEGKRVGELHAHRFVVNHKLEANRPDLLQFAQFNNQGLAPDSPERDKKVVKRTTMQPQGQDPRALQHAKRPAQRGDQLRSEIRPRHLAASAAQPSG